MDHRPVPAPIKSSSRVRRGLLTLVLPVALAACDAGPTAVETDDLGISPELVTFSEVTDQNTLRSRLTTAVRSKWMSVRQARRIVAHMRTVATRARAAVEAGDLTRRQAKRLFFRQELKAVARTLRANVAAGHLTEEEARSAWEAYRGLLGLDTGTDGPS